MNEEVEHYEKLIYENLDKFYQLRLTCNDFKGKTYVNIRKYFQTYEGDFQASKEGVSMEASMFNILALIDGLMELVSKEEEASLINEHFGKRILDLQKLS